MIPQSFAPSPQIMSPQAQEAYLQYFKDYQTVPPPGDPIYQSLGDTAMTSGTLGLSGFGADLGIAGITGLGALALASGLGAGYLFTRTPWGYDVTNYLGDLKPFQIVGNALGDSWGGRMIDNIFK